MVADRRWLERLVLRLAPHATVVSPAAWGDTVSDRARAALSLYQEGGVRWTTTDS